MSMLYRRCAHNDNIVWSLVQFNDIKLICDIFGLLFEAIDKGSFILGNLYITSCYTFTHTHTHTHTI